MDPAGIQPPKATGLSPPFKRRIHGRGKGSPKCRPARRSARTRLVLTPFSPADDSAPPV